MKAVILAGGKSSRMGQDKALMVLGKKYVIQHVIDNLSSVFEEVFISGNYSDYPYSKGIIKDIAIQKGPMGGIHSALEFCREDIFVCSCDMPFVSSDLIQDFLQKKVENKINVVRHGEKIYPVLGIYPLAVLGALEETIKNENLRMTSFLQQQNAHYIDYNDGFETQLLNINTPENFHAAEIIVNKNL
ncbi:molybdenum cofactor guanylyltransferase [Chryseobacterium muglaense]|nr:molybdenum cofactor guanylyltransferase [Chryseobacterium muglaense]